MQDKQQNNRVELENCALGKDAKGNVLMCPALRDPVGHERRDGKSGRDGCALKVLRLAALVLRQDGCRDVEPSQPSQPAKNKEGQEEVVERCSHPKCEYRSGGSETEGDLYEHARTLAVDSYHPTGCPHTRSARESSSCPIREDFLRQRAILPSIKSKNRPKGMNARAAQMAL